MRSTIFFKIPGQQKLSEPPMGFPTVSEALKYRMLFCFAAYTLAAAFFFGSPSELLDGLLRIQLAPGILLTDYFFIGGPGAALLNSALIMFVLLRIGQRAGVSVSGPFIAAFFTVGGFSFFGKNLYNIWPIMAGVLIHSRLQGEPFRSFILQAFFGTALGPLISQVSFGFGLPWPLGLAAGTAAGLAAGFVLPPLANQFVRFHQGYNLYNIGFTAGIIGMLFMAVFRGLDLQNPPTALVFHEYRTLLLLYPVIPFLFLAVIGIRLSRRPLQDLWSLFRLPGQLVSDFVASDGLGPAFLNMSLLGFISLGYVVLLKTPLNGPVLGGIFTVVGFGAFGKHVKNVLPVMAGVYLSNLFFVWEASSVGSVLAALFATTLAPVAGAYGILPGLAAGFLHMAMVMNVGYLHGGLNLYNNGFSGGFIAAILIPVLDSIAIILTPREERNL